METKALVGYNVLQTAENLCGAIILYKAGVREMEDIINGVHQMHFIDIGEPMFIMGLIKALVETPQEKHELFVKAFTENFLEFEDELEALHQTKEEYGILSV